MEGRWAQLTLSAYYDNPQLIAGTREDAESLIVEQLVHFEAGRRRSCQLAQATLTGLGALRGLSADKSNKVVLEHIDTMNRLTQKWVSSKDRENSSPQEGSPDFDPVKYYHQMMAAYKASKDAETTTESAAE